MSGSNGGLYGTLGENLKRMRINAGFRTTRALGEAIGKAHTTIGRWERDERRPGPDDIAAICEATSATADERQTLVAITLGQVGTEWLAAHSQDRELQMRSLLDFEAGAKITEISPMLIPGRTQIRDYTSAIMNRGGVPKNERETRIAVRMGRGQALQETDQHLTAYLGESALLQRIGGADVMRRQLIRLNELGEWSNVRLHVVPNASEWTPLTEGPFVFVEAKDGSTIVHLETRTAGLFVFEKEAIDAYRAGIADVEEVAMSQADSAVLIAEHVTRLETQQ